MSAREDKIDRRVIPRWRPFRLTAALGELGTPAQLSSERAAQQTAATPGLDRLVADWNAQRSLSFAADLVGAAIVRGMPERARDAAEFIVRLGDDAPLAASVVARAALGLQSPDAAGLIPTSQSQQSLQAQVGGLRRKLQEAPRNPALWVDLARSYTLRGQSEPAVKAMRTALALAPNNRFVLRSAARLFLHTKDVERAYDLLRSAEGTRRDPWLLAAEIAVASSVGRTPRFMREGKQELERDAAAPLHVSELASAIGTVELTSGRTRSARQLFREALRLPTDNALAQAQWASQHHVGLVLTQQNLDRPRSFEARAQEHRAKGQWEPALTQARQWLYDEPFSRHAAAFASYIASVPLERYDEAADLARLGLAAAPRDPLLRNNLAFALASAGQVDEAEQQFALIPQEEFASVHRPTLLATKGLLLYRRGNLEQGRLHYLQAVDEARKKNDRFSVALASLYHAREALLSGAVQAEETWMAALAEADKGKEPELPLLRGRHDPGTTKRGGN